jgi:hypothetical protein
MAPLLYLLLVPESQIVPHRDSNVKSGLASWAGDRLAGKGVRQAQWQTTIWVGTLNWNRHGGNRGNADKRFEMGSKPCSELQFQFAVGA